MPTLTYRSQWSIYRWKAATDSFLLLIQATPSKYFMRPPWDSKRSASLNFASQKWKKIRCSRIQQMGRLADCLGAFATIKVSQWGTGRACFFAPPQKPALGRRYEAYRLENPNQLGRSQTLRDESCIDGFDTGLSIKRRRRQPGRR